ILAAAGIAVGDGWSARDGAAVGQSAPTEGVAVPALAAGAVPIGFFQLGAPTATQGLHPLELEVRDPPGPAVPPRPRAPLPAARAHRRPGAVALVKVGLRAGAPARLADRGHRRRRGVPAGAGPGARAGRDARPGDADAGRDGAPAPAPARSAVRRGERRVQRA